MNVAKADLSPIQIWETYQQHLETEVPHLIQFCNTEEPSVEKEPLLQPLSF